jgi:hypothetical protein
MSLPAELTIYTVGELHPQWLAWVEQLGATARDPGDSAPVRADAVDQVDAAGLQLLMALHRSLAGRGLRAGRWAHIAAVVDAQAQAQLVSLFVDGRLAFRGPLQARASPNASHATSQASAPAPEPPRVRECVRGARTPRPSRAASDKRFQIPY